MPSWPAFFSLSSPGTLKSTFSGNRQVKRKRKLPAASSIPNWLLYSGLGLVFSLGAIKVAWGLLRIYR